MRSRIAARMTDQCTVTREVESGETATNEPTTTTETVLSGEPCQYIPAETTLVREDTGVREQRPARLRLRATAGEQVRAGDEVTVEGIAGTFAVVGREPLQDSRRGSLAGYELDLDRID